MVDNSLVYPVSSSTTEAIIQRTTEGIQKLIKVHNSPGDEEGEGGEQQQHHHQQDQRLSRLILQ
jgi:hypothetical protein